MLSRNCAISVMLFLYSLNVGAQEKKNEIPVDAPIELSVLSALTSEQAQLFQNLEADAEPPALVRNSHYWVSNEHNHQLWQPYINGIKGAFIGVGTDQNYLLAGWAKPEILILMDFDGAIAELHDAYECFFNISATPETFLKRWGASYLEDSKQKLKDCFEEKTTALSLDEGKKSKWIAARLKSFNASRGLVHARLVKTKKKYKELNMPTFLDDQIQYDYIRSLWKSKRAFAIRGDLTANVTLKGISKLLNALNVGMGVLYLSNAEQYFDYIPQFRRNMLDLPFNDQSYVVRTLGWGYHKYVEEAEQYHYNVQNGKLFQRWMEKGLAISAGKMLRAKTMTSTMGFSEIKEEPPVSKKTPKIAD